MNPYDVWFPLLAVFGVAVVAPAWMWFVDTQMASLPTHVQWLATLVLPMLVLLLGASWLEPA